MKLTQEAIIKNLDNSAWVKSFIKSYLFDRLEDFAIKSNITNDDHEGTTAEYKRYEKRGIVLWHFDDHFPFDKCHVWKEMVLFETGEFALIKHRENEGIVRSSFEGFADFHNHSSSFCPLSKEYLDLCKEKIAEKLFLAASNEAWFEYHELHELLKSWDNPLPQETEKERELLKKSHETE